jgi:hypothetical protein
MREVGRAGGIKNFGGNAQVVLNPIPRAGIHPIRFVRFVHNQWWAKKQCL